MSNEQKIKQKAHKGYHVLESEANSDSNDLSNYGSGNVAARRVTLDEASEGESQKVEMDVDDVLDNLDLGYFHYRLLLICGLCYCADAVEIGFLSYASLCIGDEWSLNAFEASSITACLFFGSLVGNVFVWQRIADTYGRRPACILGNFLVLFFGLCTIIAPNLIALLCILFITGIGVGSVFVPFDLLAEFLPAKQRGNFLTNINYFWTAGSLFVSVGAWCVISWGGWRALAVVVAAPMLLSLALTICFIPESPRWLLLQGEPVAAKEVILQVADVNQTTLPPFYFPDKSTNIDSDEASAASHVWSEIMCSPIYRWVTIKLMLLSFAWGLSYYAVVLLISRLYSDDDEVDTDSSSSSSGNNEEKETLTFNYEDIFLNALCELLGIFLTAHIIDRLGRQKSQAWLYGLGALSHVLTAWFYHDEIARNIFAAMSRICIIGACSVTVVMTPELYPTSLRVGGHALANSASRVGSILAPFLAQNMTMSVASICVILAVVDVTAALLAFTLPETSGRTLETKPMTVAEEVQNMVDQDCPNIPSRQL